MVGRRGPVQAACTTKELREILSVYLYECICLLVCKSLQKQFFVILQGSKI